MTKNWENITGNHYNLSPKPNNFFRLNLCRGATPVPCHYYWCRPQNNGLFGPKPPDRLIDFHKWQEHCLCGPSIVNNGPLAVFITWTVPNYSISSLLCATYTTISLQRTPLLTHSPMDDFTPFDELLNSSEIPPTHPPESLSQPMGDAPVDQERYGAGTITAFCVIA